MYEETQEYLKQNGTREVKLLRGIKTEIVYSGVVESWTTDTATALKFDGYKFIDEMVDARQIFMYHLGPGWKNGIFGEQKEYIVLKESPDEKRV